MSLRTLTLIAATFAAIAFPVAAEAALTTGSVNLRTGPSTGYGVITTLPPGVHVGVSRCVPGWCLVNFRGLSGWLSASYIGAGRPRYTYYPPPPPPRRIYRPAYPMYAYPSYPSYPRMYSHPRRQFYGGGPGYGLYGGGPGYGFYFNFGPQRHRH